MLKVKIKLGFVDDKGVHNKGEVLDIKDEAFNPYLMTVIDETIEAEKPTTTPKKKTSKK